MYKLDLLPSPVPASIQNGPEAGNFKFVLRENSKSYFCKMTTCGFSAFKPVLLNILTPSLSFLPFLQYSYHVLFHFRRSSQGARDLYEIRYGLRLVGSIIASNVRSQTFVLFVVLRQATCSSAVLLNNKSRRPALVPSPMNFSRNR